MLVVRLCIRLFPTHNFLETEQAIYQYLRDPEQYAQHAQLHRGAAWRLVYQRPLEEVPTRLAVVPLRGTGPGDLLIWESLLDGKHAVETCRFCLKIIDERESYDSPN